MRTKDRKLITEMMDKGCCKYCGETFYYDRFLTKFCSDECKRKFHNFKRFPHVHEFESLDIPVSWCWLMDIKEGIIRRYGSLPSDQEIGEMDSSKVLQIIREMDCPPLVSKSDHLRRTILQIICSTTFVYCEFDV